MSRTIAALALALAAFTACGADAPFHFSILGDRTGEAQPGVYEQIWKETAAETPAFVLTTGDSIEGVDPETEWPAVQRIWKAYARIPLYLTPGNHDINAPGTEQLFRRYAGRPTQYSFDHESAHFTVLDNSRSDELSKESLEF